MIRYRGSFSFDKTREEIWDALTSIDSFEDWAPWLRDVQVDGTWIEQHTRVSFNVVSPLPHRIEIEVEITDVTPCEYIEARVSKELDGSGRLVMRTVGDRTEVDLSWEVDVRGKAMRTLLFLSGPLVRWTQDWAVKAAVAGVERQLG